MSASGRKQDLALLATSPHCGTRAAAWPSDVATTVLGQRPSAFGSPDNGA